MEKTLVSSCKEARILRNERIKKLLDEGYSCEDIKRTTGTSAVTVWKIKKEHGSIQIKFLKLENTKACLYYIGAKPEFLECKWYDVNELSCSIMPYSKWLEIKDWLNKNTVWVKGVVPFPKDMSENEFELHLKKMLSMN
jgi:hypothetical protein